MATISLKIANSLQIATQKVVMQNMYLQSAIDSLKDITHKPMQPVINNNKTFGITDLDRQKISDFIKYLQTLEIPTRELFENIVINNVE